MIRARVLELLDHRWERTVTSVVAPAGFGKSTAIIQAMRADQLAPRGVEGRISCRWGCENAVRLVESAAAALGATLPPRGSPLARIKAAVGDLAPLPVSLVIDDSEALPSSGVYLLGTLLDGLPGNLHLVLVGRELPPVGLARLRAAGQLLELTQSDLRFDGAEIADLAGRLGVDVPGEHLAGWPAVIRLSLAAPGRAADDYLWEEVIRALARDDRRALQALCALGTATTAEVERVAGLRLDVDGFCTRVPLVSRDGEQLVAHSLWHPFLADLGGDVGLPLPTLSTRAIHVVAGRGDVIATGQLAIRLGEQAALRRAAVELVYQRLGTPPIEIAEAWLAAADDETAATPQMQLLRLALAHSRSATDPPSEEIDVVLDAFDEQGPVGDLAIGLAFAVLTAYETGDLGRLLELSVRASTLTEDEPDPILGQLSDAVSAASAMFQGDIGAALGHLDRPHPGLPVGLRSETITRLHWHLLLLAGRAADAAAVAAPIEGRPAVADRPLEAVARWLDGDPSGIDTRTEDLGRRRYEALSERDQFDFAAFIAPMAACLPETHGVDVAVGILSTSPAAAEVGPDAALTAVGRAAHRIVHHDEVGARSELSRFLERGPVDALTDAHLRRSLAIPYLCSPALRDRWDAAELGPSQRLARHIARAFLAARAGDSPAEPPAPLAAIAATLPCPWSVELACRVAATGPSWGIELAVDLVDRFGPGVVDELARQRTEGDEVVQRGTSLVIDALPSRPPTVLTLGVLGPLTVRRGGEVVDAPELRRVRVRELLSLLVVEQSISRDRAIEMIWPDQDPAKGRANLRVTLAHLQSALEPERPRDRPPYFVRATPTQLTLAPSSGLVVDLWEVERYLAEADLAASSGEARTRVSCLAAAVSRWRARALPDLDGVADLEATGAHVERRLVQAALTLGEIELVGGALDRAASRAERVLAADPYDERAHRLAVATRIEAKDRTGLVEVVDRLRRSLDELGLDPDDQTAVLLRLAERA